MSSDSLEFPLKILIFLQFQITIKVIKQFINNRRLHQSSPQRAEEPLCKFHICSKIDSFELLRLSTASALISLLICFWCNTYSNLWYAEKSENVFTFRNEKGQSTHTIIYSQCKLLSMPCGDLLTLSCCLRYAI